jgi:enoyl-CoA hydratase/carnithine racemase
MYQSNLLKTGSPNSPPKSERISNKVYMPTIKLQLEGSIAKLSLNHPTGNRINFAMREELLNAFETVAASEARVLIVRGEGEDFCLGGDVGEWPGIPAAKLRPKIEVFAKALDQLERLQIPTVAAVQGRCLGGGFELALACDLIVATQSAQFGCPESLLGIVTLQGGVYQLAQRIGRTRAIELAFLAELIHAEDMAKWNLVNQVVPNTDLEQATQSLAIRLASGPTRAYAATKSLLRAWSVGGMSSAKDVLYETSMPLFDTEDVQKVLRNAAEAAQGGAPFPKADFPNR